MKKDYNKVEYFVEYKYKFIAHNCDNNYLYTIYKKLPTNSEGKIIYDHNNFDDEKRVLSAEYVEALSAQTTSYSPLYKYDDKGRVCYKETNNGNYKTWIEYDNDNRVVHERIDNGLLGNGYSYYEYDDHGNLTHYYNSETKYTEYWQKFDENDHRIYFRDNNGNERIGPDIIGYA